MRNWSVLALAASVLLLPLATATNASAAEVTGTAAWSGSVTLVAASPQTDANNPATTLTATVDAHVPAGLSLTIATASGQTLATCRKEYGGIAPSSCTAVGTPPDGGAETYVAKVTDDASAQVLGVSDSVTVTNVGYTGTVSLLAGAGETDAASRAVLLTATASRPVPAGYEFTITDNTGSKLATCRKEYGQPAPSTCTAAAYLELHATRSFSSHVAREGSVPMTSSGAVVVRNTGYSDTVSLTSTGATTDAHSEATILTARVGTFVPDGFSLRISDDTGAVLATCRKEYGWPYPSSCSATIIPGYKATRTYAANVLEDAVGAISASSELTQVTDLGYTGEVTLTAQPNETSAYSRSTLLQAKASKYVPTGFTLAITDESGQTLAACRKEQGQPFPDSCSAVAEPALDSAVKYTAAVVHEGSSDLAAVSPPVLVTNVGYPGAVSLGVAMNELGGARLTATSSTYLTPEYSVSVYDDLGARLVVCASVAGIQEPVVCEVEVGAPAAGQSRTYTAYVSKDALESGAPAVGAASSPVVLSGPALPPVEVDPGTDAGTCADTTRRNTPLHNGKHPELEPDFWPGHNNRVHSDDPDGYSGPEFCRPDGKIPPGQDSDESDNRDSDDSDSDVSDSDVSDSDDSDSDDSDSDDSDNRDDDCDDDSDRRRDRESQRDDRRSYDGKHDDRRDDDRRDGDRSEKSKDDKRDKRGKSRR